MKNNSGKLLCAVLIALLLTGAKAFSQDAELPSGKAVIIMKDGNRVQDAKLWEIHSSVLEYELNGNLHDALIADIEKIRTPEADYFFSANNSLEKVSVEIYSVTDTSEIACDTTSMPVMVGTKNLYQQGYEDAGKYYDGTGAAIGGFFSGITPGLGWLVTMPIISATKPQMYNTDNPNLNKFQDKDYRAGYKKKATNKKIGNAFGGFAIGLTTFIILLL